MKRTMNVVPFFVIVESATQRWSRCDDTTAALWSSKASPPGGKHVKTSLIDKLDSAAYHHHYGVIFHMISPCLPSKSSRPCSNLPITARGSNVARYQVEQLEGYSTVRAKGLRSSFKAKFPMLRHRTFLSVIFAGKPLEAFFLP